MHLAPTLVQRHTGADTRVDLLDGTAPTQNADDDVLWVFRQFCTKFG